MCSLDAQIPSQDRHQVIVPRKGILELACLLTEQDGEVGIVLGQHHIQHHWRIHLHFEAGGRQVPGLRTRTAARWRQAGGRRPPATARSLQPYRDPLQRGTAAFAWQLSNGLLKIQANNPEQEEAEEEVQVEYNGGNLEIGFNVSYLLDVLGVIGTEQVRFILSDSNSSALVHEADNDDSAYVVMPMRL